MSIDERMNRKAEDQFTMPVDKGQGGMKTVTASISASESIFVAFSMNLLRLDYADSQMIEFQN